MLCRILTSKQPITRNQETPRTAVVAVVGFQNQHTKKPKKQQQVPGREGVGNQGENTL
jgi:hypothetical protein